MQRMQSSNRRFKRRYKGFERGTSLPSEAQILKAIQDWLDVQMAQGKLLYVRHSPSNVVGKKGEARFRRPRESQLGAPDLIVFRHAGQYKGNPQFDWTDVLCIEVKSATGQTSPAQSRWCGLAIDQGMRYILARSLDDVINGLK